MDKLSIDATNAINKGLSYGKYMAQKQPEIIAPKKPAGEIRFCVGCGCEFMPGKGGGAHKKFCSGECRERYYNAQNSKRIWENKPHAACAYCGKDFVQKTARNRFCCEDCAYEYRKREWRARNGNNQVL